MRPLRSRGTITFLTTLLACGAFLVGAVRLWGVSGERLVSGLVMVLMMLGALILLALLVVVVVKLLARYRRR